MPQVTEYVPSGEQGWRPGLFTVTLPDPRTSALRMVSAPCLLHLRACARQFLLPFDPSRVCLPPCEGSAQASLPLFLLGLT